MSESCMYRSCECRCNFRVCLLIGVWILALIAGIYIAVLIYPICLPVINTAVKILPSVAGTLIVSFLPVAVCAIGIATNIFAINCVIIAFSAFSRGCVGFLLYFLCGSGAWLMRFAFLFSSMTISVLLWWLVLRNCLFEKIDMHRKLSTVAFILFLIIVVERFLVSPLMVQLSMFL